MPQEIEYFFDAEKNSLLKEKRGISFEEMILLIEEGHLIKVMKHPNSKKYPQQEFYVIDVDGYAYLVPFVREGNKIFLKTIFPSRKATKEILGKKNKEK
jgi:uncharacterized DUF497 family protein